MKIFYHADDGTIFENKEECKEDEERFNKMAKEVHLSNGEKT